MSWGCANWESSFANPIKMMYTLTMVIPMKAKVQIYLEEEQDRRLACLARLRRVSKSRLIRESITRYLEELIPPEEDPALGIIGLAGKIGRKDLSEQHDEHLVRLLRDHKHGRH